VKYNPGYSCIYGNVQGLITLIMHLGPGVYGQETRLLVPGLFCHIGKTTYLEAIRGKCLRTVPSPDVGKL